MEEKTKLQPVISGTVTTRKKTGLQNIGSIVYDNLQKNNVKKHIIDDIILPTILDIVNTGLAGAFGLEPTRTRRTLDSVVSTVRSSEYWNASNSKGSTVVVRTAYDFDNPVYSTLSDAQTVLENLIACADHYGQISVSDIMELSAKVPSSTDYKYGWKNLNNVDIVHVTEGYMIRMPRPTPLD